MMFVVGGTNGRERERPQVPDGVIGRTPRALLELGRVVRVCVLTCSESIHLPLVGSPTLPFIGQGGAGFTDKGKEH